MWYYDSKSAIYSLDLDYRASHFCSNCAIRFRIVEEMRAHQGVSARMGFFVTLFSPLSGAGGGPTGRRSGRRSERPPETARDRWGTLRACRSISCFSDKSGHLSRCLPTFPRLYPAAEMSLSIFIHRSQARYLSSANNAPIQSRAPPPPPSSAARRCSPPAPLCAAPRRPRRPRPAAPLACLSASPTVISELSPLARR